MDLNSRLVVLR